VGYDKITKRSVAIKIMKRKKLKLKNQLTKVQKEIAINKVCSPLVIQMSANF